MASENNDIGIINTNIVNTSINVASINDKEIDNIRKSRTRQSGIELLRIVVMLQIVFLHLYLYGQYSDVARGLGQLHFLASRFIWFFCRAPVDIFVLISGYFLVTRQIDFKRNYKRLPGVYLQVLFYSIVLSIAFWYITPDVYTDIWKTLRSVFPVLSRTWYFISCYIFLLLLSPFINIVLNNINKKQYGVLLAIGFFLFSIWPNLASLEPINQTIGIKKVIDTEEGKSLISFIYMYIAGGYLRRFKPAGGKPKLKYLFAFIFLCLADFTLYVLSVKTSGWYGHVYGRFDNPLVILQSASLFLFFAGMNFHSSFVNRIASTTLGVYLIHEHPYVRPWLWSLFGTDKKAFYASDTYFFKLLAIVFLVFAACSAIDLLRQYLFTGIEKIILLFKSHQTK